MRMYARGLRPCLPNGPPLAGTCSRGEVASIGQAGVFTQAGGEPPPPPLTTVTYRLTAFTRALRVKGKKINLKFIIFKKEGIN